METLLDESVLLAHATFVNQLHFKSIDEVYDFVLGYVNVEKGQATEFKLDRMNWMASKLGDPHLGRMTIHVAGSKGKGSVATLIASALEQSGTPTGLYTSPHIVSWKERITRAGKELPDNIILRAAEEVFALVEGKTADDFFGAELPTYFELTTLIAFCAFRRAGFRAQVIEVGLGGRLDSTNIVSPDVCVITPIELEHTQYLGSTIPLIAGEKAGIIKKKVPVCTIQPKAEALEVIEAKAATMEAPCLVVGRDIHVSSIEVDTEGTHCVLEADPNAPSAVHTLLGGCPCPVQTQLVGSIYAGNMALAALALSQLPVPIHSESMQKGFAEATMLARFEIASRNPFIVLDGAHTPESVRTILSTFLQLSPSPRVLLFGCAYDKRHDEMAELLAPVFEDIIITRPGSFKQSTPEIVFESFHKRKADSVIIEDTARAIIEAVRRAREKDGSLLVTGSFYLCAEYKKLLSTNQAKGQQL